MPKHPKSNEIQRVVVRGVNWVGDAVMAIPALRALRRVLPDAHITLATRAWAAGLFADADFIDALLPYQPSRNIVRDVAQQARVWRAQKFDLALLLPNSFATAAVAFAARVPMRLGYATDGRRMLLTHPMPRPAWAGERHEIFYYLNLVGQLEQLLTGRQTITQEPPRYEISVSPERQAAISRQWAVGSSEQAGSRQQAAGSFEFSVSSFEFSGLSYPLSKVGTDGVEFPVSGSQPSQAENFESSTENSKLKAENFESSTENSKLKTENSKLKTENFESSTENSKLKTENSKLIAFCPGSTNSRAKRWPADYYAQLGDILAEKLSVRIVLIGAADEAEVSQKVAAQMRHPVLNLSGQTTLAESVALLSVADALVSNDTGPAHIAAALGRPTFVIFGPTEPKTTRPFGPTVEIIREPPACAPCMLRDCPIDHRCMTAVTPARVAELVAARI